MAKRNVTELNLTPESARPIISGIAKRSDRVFFTNHAEERMTERGITRSQVFRCLKSGAITEGPSRDAHSNWEFRVDSFAAGTDIAVVAALEYDQQGNRIIVITTFYA